MNRGQKLANASQEALSMPRNLAVQVFAAFALGYFLSTLIRSITATLSPNLRSEFNLSSGDLGLLAGGYFLGFALTQLPLGRWLDRYGPKRVILSFLSIAVLGCLAFAVAPNFWGLLAARVLCGVGVSACLMAPLTAYRLWFKPETQLRANSWMLMTGALGMVASTLPVQWLLPLWGWRMIFVALAVCVLLSMLVLAWRLPASHLPAPSAGSQESLMQSYRFIGKHPHFRRHFLLGFFSYGGMMAMQTLWIGPWLVQVSGYSPAASAQGLFGLNLCMLFTFWCWGVISPWLHRQGWQPNTMLSRGMPLCLLVLAVLVVLSYQGVTLQWWHWTLYCMASSVMSLAQPATALAFPKELAGRALSAYNLVIFAGTFVVQWCFGLLIDRFSAWGWPLAQAYSAALGVFLLCCVAGYVRFVLDNHSSAAENVSAA